MLVPAAAYAQTASSLPSSTSSVPSSVSSLPSDTAATALTVSLPAAMTAQAGSQFVLPLTVSEGKGIGSFAISVIYDPSKVTYVKTEASTDTQGFKFVDGELDADGGLGRAE
jgi:hypothetical protein